MIHKVGERISSLRKQRNMSQEDLATLLNVSRQTVSKWETGDTLPDVYNAVAIANLFHLSLDSLVLGSNSTFTDSSYMIGLKTKRHRMNLRAIVVGSFGSVVFATNIVVVRTFSLDNPEAGYIFMGVLPVLMLCWGYAIWNFIKISRISEEIKYLENVELENLRHKRD